MAQERACCFWDWWAQNSRGLVCVEREGVLAWERTRQAGELGRKEVQELERSREGFLGISDSLS